jgi:hypothetical protein
VIRAWGYTLNTNNVEPIASLSPPGSSCLGCGSLTQVLKTRHLAHWHVDFPGVVVRSIQLHKTGRVIEADADVSIPQSDSFFDDGTFRSTSPAHDQSTFQVRMKLVRHHYRLVSFTVTPGP